jgi:uncharacterized glyoxalase superfamily protein PhnB
MRPGLLKMQSSSWIHHGKLANGISGTALGAVRPYLYGNADLPNFVRHVFGAVEIERVETRPESFHAEVQIGDSAVVLETGDPPHPSAAPASVYVYVQDVDAA